MVKDEKSSYSGDAEKSTRISQPMESTRLNPAAAASALADAGEEDTAPVKPLDIKREPAQFEASMNDDISIDEQNTSKTSREREQLKTEFTGLNHRLVSYMDRVRRNEANLAECEDAKRVLEKQIAILKKAHADQVDMLRGELDERVRKSVLAEEREAQLRQELTKRAQELERQKATVESHRAQHDELERALVAEKQKAITAARKTTELKETLAKAYEQRESLKDECTRLKVENAKLNDRVRFASLELTMHESKMSAVEKELQYTSQDVTKKLLEQRTRLENMGMEKLNELRRKYDSDLERNRAEFDKKLQDTLRAYVSADQYAALETESKANHKRAEQAEMELAKREERVAGLEREIDQLMNSHREQMITERKRRERINKRLLAQTQDQEEIRKELETYRKLVESLDMENTFCNTPTGAKRLRTALELASPTVHSRVQLNKSEESTPVTFEARKALLRKALTPRRRRSSGGEDKAMPTTRAESDCNVI